MHTVDGTHTRVLQVRSTCAPAPHCRRLLPRLQRIPRSESTVSRTNRCNSIRTMRTLHSAFPRRRTNYTRIISRRMWKCQYSTTIAQHYTVTTILDHCCYRYIYYKKCLHCHFMLSSVRYYYKIQKYKHKQLCTIISMRCFFVFFLYEWEIYDDFQRCYMFTCCDYQSKHII